ncbi:MAG TPA: anti-sigma factor [Candidatus Aquilonibacter sp.]|nr:anti-sigma factor [Candidatus Aquilonibacter sp.]
MDCSQIAEIAPLYLSGELDRERASAFDAHLKSCPACMHELESQAELDARMHEIVAAEHVDSGRVERWIRERIAADPPSKVTPISWRSRRRSWMAAAMGMAALLLLAAAGYRTFRPHVAPVYADAARDHEREVVEGVPRQWLSDRASISELAEKQGIAASAPFALSSGPYHIERARLCFLDGRIFLHVVYSAGAREFSVYFRVRGSESLPGSPREVDNGRLVHSSVLGSEQVASLQTEDLTVVAVGDRYSGDAWQAARLAAKAL